MTHENEPGREHEDGPERDDSLPDARDVPTFATPEQALAASPTKVYPEHDEEAVAAARRAMAARMEREK